MNKSIGNWYADCEDWYVLSVPSNREFQVKQLIDEQTDNKYKTMIFCRDLIHCNQKIRKKIRKSLFPGYIFIHKHVNKILDITSNILPHYYIKPVTFDGIASKVKNDEMMLLLNNSNSDGVFQISNYYKEKDEVKIVDGPLKDFKGIIKFINEKKHKVNVEVTLFNRTMNLSLGIYEIRRES